MRDSAQGKFAWLETGSGRAWRAWDFMPVGEVLGGRCRAVEEGVPLGPQCQSCCCQGSVPRFQPYNLILVIETTCPTRNTINSYVSSPFSPSQRSHGMHLLNRVVLVFVLSRYLLT